MGGPEGQVIPDGFIPNGLLPSEATSVARVLDRDRWSQVEKRTAELIERIQPNQPSEERRNAVASYVQRLIMKCFSCQVFTFGSVPLKTYLPDGDIDLTAFSNNQNWKDNWASEVRDILESEEKSKDAEFRVKDVQYIQAEVKIVKCLVENIVVDISMNQLGGLCTLCFLEEVDKLISHNHLFKRSIILIKAWCYYESRILGAHHGLISTYALETLVLYIFHVYNNTFAGPFEVLYRFLEFFSKFDWDNYCLSLWGPVPIRSLPRIRAEAPRKDCGELLLNSLFLNACNSVYAVMPNNQENQEQPFVSKYFNIVDPLRANNNLGRSVSKGNFFRIRSAFAFGAQQLMRLLDCPEENIIAELDFFFRNTWDRHGKGHRPDAPYDLYAQNKQVIESSTCHESEVGKAQEPEQRFGTSDVSAVSHTQSQQANGTSNPIMTSNSKQTSSMNTFTDRGQNPNYSLKEVKAMRHFARAHSSPEFAQISGELSPQHRHIGTLETDRGHGHSGSSIIDNSKRSSSRSRIWEKQSNQVSAENQQSSWQTTTSDWRSDDAVDSKNASNSYYNSFGLKDHSEIMRMHQEEQDYFNMASPYNNHIFNGYLQALVSSNSTDLPFPVPPPIIASGFSHANSFGIPPENGTYFEYLWDHNMHYSQGLVPFAATQCFPSVGMMLNQEEIIEPVDDNLEVSELDHEDSYGGFWSEQDVNCVRGYGYEYGNIQAQYLRDKQMFASDDSNSSNSSWLTGSYGYPSKDFGTTIENRWLTRENYGDDPPDERTVESDANSTASSRFVPTSHSTTLSSDSSSNGPSTLTRDQKGVKSAHPTQPFAQRENQYEEKLIDCVSSQPDDNREWNHQSTVDTNLAESTTVETVISDETHQSTSYARGPITASNLGGPVIHPFVGPGSRQRAVDDQGLMPITFYPTGPPFPFFTMLPFPTETITSYAATSPRDVNAELSNHHARQSNVILGSTVRLEQSDTPREYNSIKHDATSESSEEQRSDILNSDFASHWQNLQYGRFCQNAQLQGPLLYPPPLFVPATHLQGQFPLNGPGRSSANINIMPRRPHPVPRMPIQRAYDSHLGIGPHFPTELPRFHGGTGTYLPNPRFIKNRHYRNTRNHRESYSYDWRDYNGEREGNWNSNSKRSGNRSQFRYQVERQGTRMEKTNPSYRRPDKSWNSYKNGSFSPYNSHNSSFNSSISNKHVTANVRHGMQSLPVAPLNEISPSESAVPPAVMLYPYNQNVSCDSNEGLDFGSLGPVHRTGTNKASHEGESSHAEEGDSEQSSPDDDSSPNFRRVYQTDAQSR
ncbi:hypothetical protein L6164_030355 [Bauhinia variegata]|uniref:Uncharacterized protein n=1 Tax=Bauhinia variegata TaxID=167791 RepID=A0ACB9LBI8_BAUVA|nr:hypothetical protein L6164_030355 [Bauhinia variegata]